MEHGLLQLHVKGKFPSDIELTGFCGLAYFLPYNSLKSYLNPYVYVLACRLTFNGKYNCQGKFQEQ
jgi:hypothetical protein